MSAKPETTYANGVHKYLPASVYVEKMNNPYRGGTPDYYVEGFSRVRWIEYKFIEVPKRDSTIIKPNLSSLQREWLGRNFERGHRPLVVIGSRIGGVALWDPGVWDGGLDAASFRRFAKSKEEIALLISSSVQ